MPQGLQLLQELGRNLPLLTPGNCQDDKCVSRSVLTMEGAVAALTPENILDYRPIKETDTF